MFEKIHDRFKKLVQNRMVILFIIILGLFSILLVRLYRLQIIEQEQHQSAISMTTIRTLPISALRGEIYDRLGRPLAVNRTAFRVKMDLSVPVRNLNEVIQDIIEVFEENGEVYSDTFPISKSEPFEFDFSSPAAKKRWEEDMGLKEAQRENNASELIAYFRRYFAIPTELSATEARNLIAMRAEIFLQRYRQYQSITLAEDIAAQTTAVIEEQHERFPGIYIEAYAKRYYPEGETFSHILGYIGSINEKELSEFSPYGYTNTDLVGKLGIEKAYELILNGKKGEERIEVDARGKRVKSVQVDAPTKGGNVYLTLDSELQKKTFEVLRENLKELLIQKLDSGEVTFHQVLQSLTASNKLSVKNIMAAEEGTVQSDLKYFVLSKLPAGDEEGAGSIEQAKKVIIEGIATQAIQPREIVFCLIEQKVISCNEEQRAALRKGNISPYQLIREKIVSGEISPSDTNLDPSTGSAAVVDIHSGDVLALVSYPSYDNNRLVNTFDNTYYQRLLDDPTTPLINRPLMERKAPGSVLKMITAVAGLESGAIHRDTKIQDVGIYQKAGMPFAKCLIYSRYGGTHGSINVAEALEVSCNYFFYETLYRMGNEAEGTTLKGVTTFNEYMKKFGLGTYSGIQIEELRPKIASPEAKKDLVEALNKNATLSQKKWMDGDSIRSAIGQSYNSFSVMHIAKYIATLANGETRYRTNLIKGIRGDGDTVMTPTQPVVEEELRIAPETLQSVREGMLSVTMGSRGTLRQFFKDFPIQVAAKTGTAEEANSRPSHTWFAGFAPYEQPQIAVVIMIPFGESTSGPATVMAKEIMEEYFGLYKQSGGKLINTNDFVN
ncbi:MAG: pbpA 1 [Clostridia bacterium]|nr:pbpA 1 [Clostridia bacterium]